MDKSNKKLGVWATFFGSGSDSTTWALHARYVAKNFLQGPNTADILAHHQSDSTLNKLDEFVQSPKGQELCVQLLKELQSLIVAASEHALPAHDLYQFQLDATEALRFYDLEKPKGHRAAFLIAAVGHDIGRLYEGAIYDPDRPHRDWTPHAYFSYMMMDKILSQEKYADMPNEFKWHMKYAVAAHSGENAKTYIGRAAQAVDRWSGLHGPQGFMRAVAYAPLFMQGTISLPQNKKVDPNNLPKYADLHSAIQILEFFGRNMREDIGNAYVEQRRGVTVQNMAILLKWTEKDAWLRQVVFSTEIRNDGKQGDLKKRFQQEVIDAGRAVANSYPSGDEAVSAEDLTNRLVVDLEGPHTAAKLTDWMKQDLLRSVKLMSASERRSFCDTLKMVEDMLHKAHIDEHQVVDAAHKSDNPLCRTVAEWISSPVFN